MNVDHELEQSAGEARVGELLAGRYRLERVIARGGSSVLYEARHTRTGRAVAVKLLRLERKGKGSIARQRFEREAQAALSIAHPNVVDVLDRDEAADGTPFIAMELLHGRSLHEIITTEGALDAARTLELLLPIIGAVAVAHDHGVLHRDLKPANIFVVERPGAVPVPKLLDFGIARLAELPMLTAPGRAIGTTGFMAPEQLRGAEQSAATDVWALGAVLYTCLTATVPFSEQQLLEPTTPALDRRGLREPSAHALIAVIERALEWRPSARPEGARALARALLLAARRAFVPLPVEPDVVGLPDWRTWLHDGEPDIATLSRALGRGAAPAAPALLAEDSGERPSQPELGIRLAGRFELVRRIGAGAMGTVLETLDHTTGERVALKLLQRVDPNAIYRLKQEFRALARVAHPNLAALHELFEAEGRYFFTMELLRGVPLLDFVRQEGARAIDVPRLVHVFGQLATGLSHLHSRHFLHRDLKPSNVLVEPSGRVVIVDFGLAQPFAQDVSATVTEHDFVGTPAYAAPEQVDPARAGPASDWYAVGAMLYEALCGARPFSGGSHQIMMHKAVRPPEPPSQRTAHEVPRELEDVCMRLLERDPEQRAGGGDLIAALHACHAVSHDAAHGTVDGYDDTPFSGRTAELDRLTDAWRRAREGQLAAAFVTGPSGIGKTTLARAFLAGAKRSGAQVLESRCHAQEAVHYKAFDGAIDALSSLLCRTSQDEPLPAGVEALAQLFPVLRRVPRIDQHMAEPAPSDDRELRARAFSALRALLAWSAARCTIILFIDDLHWGDLDSAHLLRELLFGEPIPGVFMLATYRPEPDAPLLSELFRDPAGLARCEQLEIGPLARDVVTSLALGALPAIDRAEVARSIADTAQGHPMFALELIRFAREQGANAAVSTSLREALSERLARSSGTARELLEIVCVAGQPLARSLALEIASDNVQRSASATLRELRLGRLLRESSRRDEPHLEPYHDQVRETAVAELSEERRLGIHRALADNFASHDDHRLEMAMHHYRLAGLTAHAAPLAARAGELATEALAFDRAAELYTIATEHAEDDVERRRLRLALAKACVRAGRTFEAAQHYERASMEAGDGTRLELQRHAMAQFFLSGHVERGIVFLPKVTDQLDVPRFPSRWSIVRNIAVALSLACLGYPRLRRRSSPVAADDRALASSLWSIAGALSHVRGDTAMATHFARLALFQSARHGLGAIYGQATGLFMLALSFVLSRPSALIDRRLAAAQALVEREGDDEARRFLRAIRSGCDLCASRNASAYEAAYPVATSDHIDPDTGGATRALARNVILASLYWMGRLRELAPLAERWIEDAHNAGDRYLELTFRIMSAQRFLRLDDASRARAEIAAAHALRIEDPARGVSDPWWEAGVELYDGEPERALALCEALRSRFRTFSALAGTHKALFALCEGGAFAACVERGMPPERALRGLASASRAVRRTRVPLRKPIIAQLTATAAFVRGDSAIARQSLRRAVAEYDALGLRLHAASCRLVIVHLDSASGAGDREALRREALGVFEAEGIASPTRWARMLVPGFGLV